VSVLFCSILFSPHATSHFSLSLPASFFLTKTFFIIKKTKHIIDFVNCSKNINNYNKRKCYTAGNADERQREANAIKKNIIDPVDINLDDLVTSKWYKQNPNQMWTQHFIYFCYENEYYNLYRHFTSPNKPLHSKALIAHWKEKGEHFDGNQSGNSKNNKNNNIQPLLELDDINKTNPSIMDFPLSSTLKRFDWDGNLVVQEQEHTTILPPVVMSAAIGYSLQYFKKFIGTLRKYYAGDVWLLISKQELYSNNTTNGLTTTNTTNTTNMTITESTTTESIKIRNYLKENNVKFIESTFGESRNKEKSDWEKINRDRFQFFNTVCDEEKYSLCLTTDFRDSIFQSNPFSNMHRLLPLPPSMSMSSMSMSSSVTNSNSSNSSSIMPLPLSSSSPQQQQPKGILHVFEHNKDMSEWHYQKMNSSKCNLYNDYSKYLKNTKIINGGMSLSLSLFLSFSLSFRRFLTTPSFSISFRFVSSPSY